MRQDRADEINAPSFIQNILRLIFMWMELMKQNFQMYIFIVYWFEDSIPSKIICALNTRTAVWSKRGSIDMVAARLFVFKLWRILSSRLCF